MYYCNALFSCLSKASINDLTSPRNATARLLTHSHKSSHITPLLNDLQWPPHSFRFQLKILFFFTCEVRLCVVDLLHPYSPNQFLRSTDKDFLGTHLKGDCGFHTSAPKLWNSLHSYTSVTSRHGMCTLHSL